MCSVDLKYSCSRYQHRLFKQKRSNMNFAIENEIYPAKLSIDEKARRSLQTTSLLKGRFYLPWQ
jgi:hypothetical protein